MKYFYSLLLCSFLVSLQAQDRFDRLYRTQNMRGMSSNGIEQLDDKGYIVCSTVDTMTIGDFEYSATNITKFNEKGNVDWSRDYFFQDSSMLLPRGSIITGLDSGFIACGMLFEDELQKNIIYRVDDAGEIIWANRVGIGTESDVFTAARIKLIKLPDDQNFIFLGTDRDADEQKMLLTSINQTDGSINWSRHLTLEDEDGNQFDFNNQNIILAPDTTLWMTGSFTDQKSIYVMQIDPFSGELLLSREISLSEFEENASIFALDISHGIGADTAVYIAGFMDDSETVFDGPILLKLDSIGVPVWGKRFNYANDYIENRGIALTNINNGNILQLNVGQIRSGEPVPSMTVITEDGEKRGEAVTYDVFLNTESNDSEIIPTQEGGAILAATGFDHVQANLFSRLIKVNPLGSSSCEQPASLVLVDMFLEHDSTLVINIEENQARTNSVESISHEYIGYTNPVLSLAAFTHCPGEPFSDTLDATIPGAVSYKWKTSEDGNKIVSEEPIYIVEGNDVRDFEDIQYIVEVRVEEDNCYTLCDTTNLSSIPFPMVQIQVAITGYCNMGDIILTAQPDQDVDFAWSTGENSQSITVNEFGTYSVTVTNDCGDSGSAAVNLNTIEIPEYTLGDIQITNTFCQNDSITLSIETDAPLDLITWSTGETNTTSITVTEPGTYSVSLGDTPCTQQDEPVSVDLPSSLFDPDSCVPSLDGCVFYPNAVYSKSNDPINRRFGPSLITTTEMIQNPNSRDSTDMITISVPSGFIRIQGQCPLNNININDFETYELKVFNRWGNEVFSTDNIQEEWNLSDTNDVPGSYAYYARFSIGDLEGQTKGSFLLIR